MKHQTIIIEGAVCSWTARLLDTENDVNMVIGRGRSIHEALNSLLSDVLVSSGNGWIEERNKKLAEK